MRTKILLSSGPGFTPAELSRCFGPDRASPNDRLNSKKVTAHTLSEVNKMFSYRLPAAAILLAAFVVTACDDDDDDPVQPTATTFNVNLTRANVTPACAAGGANATGTATVTINAQNTTVTVSNLTFTGLSGAATSAHIHSGAAGSAGITTPIFSFAANPTSPATATFTAANYPATAPAGAPANFAAFVTAMKNDQSFIDVHTAACPNGEIRGNLVTP